MLINSDHRYVITLANSDDKTESKYLGTTHQAAGKETEFRKNDSKIIKQLDKKETILKFKHL